MVLRNVTDYIKSYDRCLPQNVCRNLVALAKKTKLERWEQKGRPQCNMFNITHVAETEQDPDWMKMQNLLIPAIKSASELYMTQVGCKDHWPVENGFEQIKLKHYECERNDRFDEHVDVGDHSSARRFLALFFYLNDVAEGGETHFPNVNISIKASEGKVLVFPPTWMFAHSGKAPLSNDKYVVGTYLHYI